MLVAPVVRLFLLGQSRIHRPTAPEYEGTGKCQNCANIIDTSLAGGTDPHSSSKFHGSMVALPVEYILEHLPESILVEGVQAA